MSKVIVAGSINMDIVAQTDTLPVAGQTVSGKEINFFPGGKGANQAIASKRMGADTILIGAIGDDAFGLQMHEYLKHEDVNLSINVTKNAATGTALIAVSATDNQIIVIPGANEYLVPTDLQNLNILDSDVLLSQFEIRLETIAAFFSRGKEVGATTILNPSPFKAIPKNILMKSDILIVNETELSSIASANQTIDTDDTDRITDLARNVLVKGPRAIILTLGHKGFIIITRDQVIQKQGIKVNTNDTTGAGDCFAGVLASCLATGQDLERAANTANKAAAISVTKQGASPSMPTADELKNFYL